MTDGRDAGPRPPALRGRVVSIQVGLPAPLPWRGASVQTAIVKRELAGPVAVTQTGVEGDGQADLSAHGGPDKAVCAYPLEHVAGWARRLGVTLPPGAFGENLTLTGLLEPEVHVGDVFEAGTAVLQVSQPRGPCFKLAARWGRRELPAVMARAGASGFYLRVLREGRLQAGDQMRLIERRSAVSIAEVMRVTYVARGQLGAIDSVLAVPELAERWRRSLHRVRARAGEPIADFGS